LQDGELGADNTGTEEESFVVKMVCFTGPYEHALHVAHAKPRQSSLPEIDGSEAENDTARSTKSIMASLYERNQLIVGKGLENGRSGLSGSRCALAMADAIDCSQKGAIRTTLGYGQISGLDLIAGGERCDAEFDEVYSSCWS
jgi:hypothetical protein